MGGVGEKMSIEILCGPTRGTGSKTDSDTVFENKLENQLKRCWETIASIRRNECLFNCCGNVTNSNQQS